MSMYDSERRRRSVVDNRARLGLIKAALAQSITLRIHEELASDPDTTSFAKPLLGDEPLVRRMLRLTPERVAEILNFRSHIVRLALDETVEPPMLHIHLEPIVTDTDDISTPL